MESTPGSGAIRVLVANDDEAEAAQIREHLESLGYAVDWASDGDHAIAMAATGEYQVMLLDVHMRVYRGVEVMRRLHLLAGRPLRVIAVTADRIASLREELARMGVDGYLTTPIELRKLQQELDRILRRSSR